jgi:hypothetical protein
MPKCFKPAFEILPAAQREIWPRLAPTPGLSLVLYGGTAIALQLGHRESVDFDFFSSEPLSKDNIKTVLDFTSDTKTLQDSPETLVVSVPVPSGQVKLSFFGGLGIGRVSEPLLTTDKTLLVAAPEDLLATKLKAILDRADLRDYRDIAQLLRAGMSLPQALAAFKVMFKGEPAQVLRAIGYFGDGNLAALGDADRRVLVDSRDSVRDLPDITLAATSLAVPVGPCREIVEFQSRAS